MPLKRRKVDKDAVNSQGKEDKDEEDNEDQVLKSSSNWKKRNFVQSFIVISDSDGEREGKDQNGAPRKKTKTQSARSKLEVKRRIAQMTEEEQLELAVRMSEQEASHNQKEEELLRKAIAESLNSGQSPKFAGKCRAISRQVAVEHTKLVKQELEGDSEGSAATCPDSLPPSEPQSPVRKPTSLLVSDASCPLPIRKPVHQPLFGASCPSPIESPIRNSASQSLCGNSSPVKKPGSQPLSGASSSSPDRKPSSQLLPNASCSSTDRKPASQLLPNASCSSTDRKPASQPLSNASCSSADRKPASQPLSGASRLSPVRKSSSQPLFGASCLSPIIKSTSKPLDGVEMHSPRNCAAISDEDPKSPVVVLQRLSQDVVESSSVVLSPSGSSTSSAFCRDPPSPALTDSSDFVPMSPVKYPLFAPSPKFPRRAPCPWQLAPRRLVPSLIKSQRIEDEDLEKLPLDRAVSPGMESTSGSSTPGDLGDPQDSGILDHCGSPQAKCDTHTKEIVGTLAPQALQPLLLGDAHREYPKVEDEGTVHYYWGVPFCPKGVNPNQYTKVILCQLEVYQKSLKQAQSQLLQKREYGPPIMPIPPSLRRSDRYRGDKNEDGSQDSAWGGQGSQEEPVSDNSRESSLSPAAEDCAAPMDDGPTTSYMQHPSSKAHCVEEMPDDSAGDGEATQGMPRASATSCTGVQENPEGAGSQEIEEKENEVVKEEKEEEQEEDDDFTTCPETQPSLPSDVEDAERGHLPSVENSSAAQNDPDVPAEEVENVAPTVTEVECPLCGRGFLPEQIELHAAYCDGGALNPVLTRRQRGIRSTALDLGDLLSSPDTGKTALKENAPILQFPGLGKCEKCYVCKDLVPLREYQGHVDNCLQTAVLETQGSRRLRCTKEVGRSEGRLLSMLDQSESMSADAEARITAPGPGSLRPYPSEDEEEAAGHNLNQPSSPEDFSAQLDLSNSPIKAFVSISEATDCLVDFKQQFTKGPSRRAGRGLGRGAGRRSRSRGWRGKRR